MPNHHGLFGGCVHGGEHRCHLVVERGGRRSVTLTREGEGHGAVAACLELGRDVVPGGSVEPQAGDEQDVHDLALLLQCGQITFGIEPVFPFLVEDDAETFLDGKVLLPGPAGLGLSHLGGELLVGE